MNLLVERLQVLCMGVEWRTPAVLSAPVRTAAAGSQLLQRPGHVRNVGECAPKNHS